MRNVLVYTDFETIQSPLKRHIRWKLKGTRYLVWRSACSYFSCALFIMCIFCGLYLCHPYIIHPYTYPYTGLFKKKYTFSKNYFTKTTDAKSISCVRMERKSLKVLISMIWSGTSLRLWLLLPVTCCDECGKSWIIDLTYAALHVGLTSSACKVWK
jgi:hypothetical protein